MGKLLTYFHTLKYMKAKQIGYRLYYVLRSKYRKKSGFTYPLSLPSKSVSIKLIPSIESYDSLEADGTFSFLNLSHKFADKVDWNYLGHGKLWAYNLNYFDFMQQRDKDISQLNTLLEEFIDGLSENKEGLEPFPIALRGINWVKFFNYQEIKNQRFDNSLYAQYKILADNLEYHLLGNHLLENGFALLFGAYYFQDEALYEKAKEILVEELDEQILSDGAHFEITPMYHQIMLYRVLDCINLVKHNSWHEKELLPMLEKKAGMMLSWLAHITYSDGSIPHFNDSADMIAPTSTSLFEYANRLEVNTYDIPLGKSGYRAEDRQNYEMCIDVAEIGPSYIPGHAHSDTFNFELKIAGKPFIVDTGISTYESNARRLEERQTAAHNTVKVARVEQSQVWSSFRVAKRASIVRLEELEGEIKASHDGYQSLDVIHQRTFQYEENRIIILDELKGAKGVEAEAFLHFHPDVSGLSTENSIIKSDLAEITVEGSKKIQLDDFKFAVGYNKLADAKCVKITFVDSIKTVVSLNL